MTALQNCHIVIKKYNMILNFLASCFPKSNVNWKDCMNNMKLNSIHIPQEVLIFLFYEACMYIWHRSSYFLQFNLATKWNTNHPPSKITMPLCLSVLDQVIMQLKYLTEQLNPCFCSTQFVCSLAHIFAILPLLNCYDTDCRISKFISSGEVGYTVTQHKYYKLKWNPTNSWDMQRQNTVIYTKKSGCHCMKVWSINTFHLVELELYYWLVSKSS